jgi:hypothetical protein
MRDPIDKSSASTGADVELASINKNAPQRGLRDQRWRGSLGENGEIAE